MKWLSFIRKYGPISRNDNMYDETIRRSAKWSGFDPIHFVHPAENQVLNCFTRKTPDPVSVILTGTAGDGKTHLCRQVWEKLKGDPDAWASDDPYLSLEFKYPKDRKSWPSSGKLKDSRTVKIHFIRDLSGWAPQQGLSWDPEKENLLQRFCVSLFDPECDEVFIIAANDGQLVESWRRLSDTDEVKKTRVIFENLLVLDEQEQAGVRLKMFNLSHWSSAELFDRTYEAFVNHPGWRSCYEDAIDEGAFSEKCPVRRNYELLKTPLVKNRIRALIELCENNDLHLPIRQLLLLLTNSVLGHSDCNRDRLIRPIDIPRIINAGTISKASIYNNVFGGNLTVNRRSSITVFDYFDRFQIGNETTNRIDNILIFGDEDQHLGKYFDRFLRDDTFYGADDYYFTVCNQYIEDAEDELNYQKDFLKLLVIQRRSLFFKIPDDLVNELNLWELTVFRYAGEYLSDINHTIAKQHPIKRAIRSRLVKGLNRIFTGMLVSTDRDVLLATSGNYSQARICRILVDRVSVEPRHGERVLIEAQKNGRALLTVYLASGIKESLELNLVRYEFLSRVAIDGALPANFSKECYEDILAFKSRLIAAYKVRQENDGVDPSNEQTGLNLIDLSANGKPEERFVEILI